MSWLAIILLLASPPAMGPATVEPRKQVLDFGEAIKGTVVEARAELVNHAPHTAEVHVAALGCGCLWTDALTLAPGAAGSLPIRLDTSKTPVGFVQRFVSFRVEPGGEVLAVELRGTVHPPFRAAPQVLVLSPGQAEAMVEVHGTLPFEVARLVKPVEGWVWTTGPTPRGHGLSVALHRKGTSVASAPPAFVFELKHRLGLSTVEVVAIASRSD